MEPLYKSIQTPAVKEMLIKGSIMMFSLVQNLHWNQRQLWTWSTAEIAPKILDTLNYKVSLHSTKQGPNCLK